MSQHRPTDDIKIKEVKELLPPIAHLYELPVTPQVANLVYKTRHEISDLVHGRDNRLLVIIGPCSIHDASTEFLDMITPQYYADLISWGAIGARTTESQVHRELASGLSCPVGFKNGTDGNLKIAIDAIGAANHPHHFLSVTKAGHSAIVHTSGNPDCHAILRGGKEPNYSAEHVKDAVAQLQKAGVSSKLMVDCSHANSRKDFRKQMDVARDVAAQLKAGEENIMGVMVESHLVEGRQDKPEVYGQSITDACIGWDTTEELLALLAEAKGYQA